MRTEHFETNRKAGRQMYGYYRNPYTDDESIRDAARPNRRTVSNTAPLVIARQAVFAEGRWPAVRDRSEHAGHAAARGTSAAAGRARPSARIPSSIRSHGEMVSLWLRGHRPCQRRSLHRHAGSAKGKVTDSVTVKVPYVSVIHDMALTHRHVVIPFGGYVTSAERLKQGKIHWGWDASKPSMIGVMPRGGSAKDMRWFQGPERCMMHTFNAHSEGNKVILYAPFYDSNFFPSFRRWMASPWNPAKARAFIRKITLDLDKPGNDWKEEILWPMQVGDLGKVDPRVLSLPTRYLYTLFTDDERPVDRAKMGPGAPARPTNSYLAASISKAGRWISYFAGPDACAAGMHLRAARRQLRARGRRLPHGRGFELRASCARSW